MEMTSIMITAVMNNVKVFCGVSGLERSVGVSRTFDTPTDLSKPDLLNSDWPVLDSRS